MSVCARRVRGDGFTLIELLVVVAILAVMLAILLPKLGAARSKAREVACSSNLRQVGLVCVTYAEEFEKFLPVEATEHNPHLGLMDLARERMNVGPAVFYCPEAFGMELSAQSTKYTPVGATDSVVMTEGNVAAGNISYVYWSFLANKVYTATGQTWRNAAFRPRKLRLGDAVQVGSLAPVDAGLAERWVVSDFFRQGAPFPHTRKHASGVNVMYQDGHCELVYGSPQTAFR